LPLSLRYKIPVVRLRRAWLWTIGCVLLIGGSSALLMRFDLMDPKPTLSPELYGHAFALHGLVSAGGLLAAMLAIPALVVKPGRGSVVLGFLALGLWVGAMALLISLDLRGSQEWLGFSPRSVLLALAASSVLGAAQIAVSLPANSDRPQLVAATGGITALAIVAIPLIGGELPTAVLWLLATTAIACGLIPDAMRRAATTLALVVIVPCLFLGWAATALVHAVHTDFPFHDTVAVLSPLPVTGGALLGTLLLAATRWRSPQRRLAHVGAALITAGAGLTSLGFFLLGLRGLPRRYLAYLPEFQSLQVIVGAAAVVTVIGCLLALEALRRGTCADV
jgi:heme/copper-type cytochrome/quinol oxidase subunit 1